MEDEQKIKELEEKISDIERRFENLEALKNEEGNTFLERQLLYPLDDGSKKIITNILKNKIIDVVWEDYFYYSTFFDSLDGWSLSDSSGGGSATTGAGVTLETGITTGNQSVMAKFPDHSSFLSFDERSRFKSGFEIPNLSVSNIEFAITFGTCINSLAKNHYGFRLDSGTLKGVTADGSTISEVDLLDISAQTRYLIEAINYPGEKVVFYVSDGTDSNELIERGTITENLPSGDVGITDNSWFNFYIETKEDAAKQLYFSFLEYIQQKEG